MDQNSKGRFSTFLDYAMYAKLPSGILKSFLASIVWNWGILIAISCLLVGPFSLITGGNFIRGLGFFALIFGGGQLAFPFVGLILKGADESYVYSYGFYYGTLGMTLLFHKIGLADDIGAKILIASAISALICWVVHLKRNK